MANKHNVIARWTLMAVAMLVVAFGLVTPAWATMTGSGTEADPYKVDTADDLVTAMVSTEGDTQIYVELSDNITGPCIVHVSGHGVHLDLNGKSITSTDADKPTLEIHKSYLTITDSVGGGMISGGKKGVELLENCDLTLQSGTISGTQYGVDIDNGSNFRVEGSDSSISTIIGGTGVVLNTNYDSEHLHIGVKGLGWSSTTATGAGYSITTGYKDNLNYKMVRFPAVYLVTVENGTADKYAAAKGDTVTITANEPEENKAFVQWSTVEGVNYAQADLPQTTFPMPEKDVTVSAVYAPIVIEGVNDSYTYTGEPIDPTKSDSFKVSLEGVDEVIPSDSYDVTLENNVHAGTNTAQLTVTFKDPERGSKTVTFSINKIDLELTAKTLTKEYDGTPLTGDYSCVGLAENDSIESVDGLGSQTDVGTCESTVADATIVNRQYGDSTGDYNITYGDPGTLTVMPYSKKVIVKITGHTDTVTYDGAEHEVTGYDATASVDFYDTSNIEFKGTASAKGTKVGNYPMGLSASDFSNKSANFTNVEFEVTDGALTIEEANTATLTFDLNGGTLDGKTDTYTMTAKVGDTVKLPKAPTRNGYTFRCWKGSEYAAEADYKVEGDHTFIAEWTKNVTPTTTYTISFDANGGSGTMNSLSVKAGNSVTLTANKYTRSGHTFTGWNTQADGKGTAYKDKATITPEGNMRLYAQWSKGTTASSKSTTSSKPTTSSKSTTSSKPNTLARTGDSTSYVPVIVLAVAGVAIIAFAVYHRKKK